MAKTIVALDIGSHAIKGVVIDRDFRSFAVRRWVYIPVPRTNGANGHGDALLPVDTTPAPPAAPVTTSTEAPPATSPAAGEAALPAASAAVSTNGKPSYAGAVSEFISHLEGYSDDGLVVAAPGTEVLTRLVTLPFTGRKVGQVLGFEMEGEVPFDLDDWVLDYEVVASVEGQSRVLTALMKRDAVGQYLHDLESASLNPRVVALDLISYADLLKHIHGDQAGLGAALPAAGEGTTAVIDIGASKTNVSLFEGPAMHPVAVRAIRRAGNVITEAIAQEFGLSWEDAEAGKCRDGCVLRPGESVDAPDRRRISDTITRALEPLVRELALTLRGAGGKGAPLKDVFLCGGTAQLPGLADYLTARLGRAIAPLTVPDDLRPLEQAPQAPPAVFAQSLALGLAPSGGAAHVNFRRRDFVFRSRSHVYKGKLLAPIALTAALIVVLIANVMASYRLNQKRLAIGQAEQAIVFGAALPGETMKPGEGLTQMTARRQDMTKLLTAAGTLTGLSPLDVLTLLSQKLPPELDITMTTFRVEKGGGRFGGVTHNYGTLDAIKAKLSEAPEFEKVTVADSRPGVEEGSIKFVITFDFASQPDAAAPAGAAGGTKRE